MTVLDEEWMKNHVAGVGQHKECRGLLSLIFFENFAIGEVGGGQSQEGNVAETSSCRDLSTGGQARFKLICRMSLDNRIYIRNNMTTRLTLFCKFTKNEMTHVRNNEQRYPMPRPSDANTCKIMHDGSSFQVSGNDLV